jgi:hypothetical protein
MTPHERLERELRMALQREEAPPDLADRILARVNERDMSASMWLCVVHAFHLPAMKFATAATLCIALVGGSLEYRHRQQEIREGEAAKQQLMLALRITGSKLQYVENKVKETSSQQFRTVERGDEQQ